MQKEINLRRWILTGVLLEISICIYCWLSFKETAEMFHHAARYSGRVSLLIYLYGFYFFAYTYHRQNEVVLNNLRKIIITFCILHIIHFGFLATSVYLNHVSLVPYKLAGGFIAYLMIIIYPLIIGKVRGNRIIPVIYFYYVGIVMALTYVGRLKKGGFDGHSSPEAFHYFGIASVILAFIVCSYFILVKRK